jgi:hypothetical protein
MIPFGKPGATLMATRKSKRTAKTARTRTAAKRTKKAGGAAKRGKSTATRKRIRTGGAAKKAKQAKRVSRPRGYNPQAGSPAGKAVGDVERLEQLMAEFMAQGMSAHDAREHARAIMRSTP